MDAGGAGFRLRGLRPTLGTCVGNPTVGKRLRLSATASRMRKHVGFLYARKPETIIVLEE